MNAPSPIDCIVLLNGHLAAARGRLDRLAEEQAKRSAERKAAVGAQVERAKTAFGDLVKRRHAEGVGFSQKELDMVPDAIKRTEAALPRVPSFPIAAKLAMQRAHDLLPALKTALASIEEAAVDFERALATHDENRINAERGTEEAAKAAADEVERKRVEDILARRREEDLILAQAEKLGLERPRKAGGK
jgi:hypothetical protein